MGLAVARDMIKDNVCANIGMPKRGTLKQEEI